MEKNTSIENIQKETLLTKEADGNRRIIDEEIERRIKVGLISKETVAPSDLIADYLERVNKVSPRVNWVAEEIIQGKEWRIEPRIILTIPVVGVGGQEEEVVMKSLLSLTSDPMVRSGEAGVLILVNRPENLQSDETKSFAESAIEQMGINGIVLDLDVPSNLGYFDGPFANEIATEPNDAPIGILRDLLNISAMKLWLKSGTNKSPVLLQMDGDFEGFARGSLVDVVNKFQDPKIKLLQCTSDWDSKEFRTESDPGLWIGSELMREIPQIIKRELNNQGISSETRKQLIFGEAIQRGIQVPQAERMESVARKAGYGLLRLKEDELDQNIRTTEKVFPGAVRTADDIIFVWSNRRAVRSWIDLRQPPISQWVNGFSVDDKVRGEIPERRDVGFGDIELSINRTLARFPIPKRLEGVYDNYQQPIIEILERYGLELSEIFEERKGEDLYYLQIKLA
jgi:hypothetical protein